MEYPDNSRIVLVKLKDSKQLIKARFASDRLIACWLKEEGHPLSNAYLSLASVEDWLEVPLDDVSMPYLSTIGAGR